MQAFLRTCTLFALLPLAASSACSGEDGSDPCTDCASGPGGSVNTGGGTNTGGSSNTGGTSDAGGAQNPGGWPGTGGSGAGGSGGGDAGAGGSDNGGSGGSAPHVHTGDGTYYAATGGGNCSFPPSPGNLMVAALNTIDYDGSRSCGGCISITGPLGSVVVRVVDRCPECAEGDVDMSPQAFEQVAEISAGRVPIEWHEVPCDVTGPIAYHFKEGSNQWWTAIQVRNIRYRIESLEGRTPQGDWQTLQREMYNYFIGSPGLGPGPYDLRATDVFGHVLEDYGVPFLVDQEVQGSAQFPQ